MITLGKFYRELSDNQKMSYWSTVSNILLVIITFWLGFAVQYWVADRNASVAEKANRAEYVDRIYPTYERLSNSEGFHLLQLLLDEQGRTIRNHNLKKKEISSEVSNRMISHAPTIIAFADSLFEPAKKYSMYLNYKDVQNALQLDLVKLFAIKAVYQSLFDSMEFPTRKTIEDDLNNLLVSPQLSSLSLSIEKTRILKSEDRKELIGLVIDLYKELTKARLSGDENAQLFCQSVFLTQILSYEEKVINAIFQDMFPPQRPGQFEQFKGPFLWLILAFILGAFIVLIYINFVTPKKMNQRYSREEVETIIEERLQYKTNWETIEKKYTDLSIEYDKLCEENNS